MSRATLSLAAVLVGGVLAVSSTALAQSPPVVTFVASGEHSHSSARVTVDATREEGSTLTARLTSPSGGAETLNLDRDGRRHTWVGHLREAGTWRVEAILEGPDGRQTGEATVSLSAGEPTCSLSVSAPAERTDYIEAEITVNVCEAQATTGSIATRYIRVMQDGAQISGLDATDQCERTFILQGAGLYDAVAEVVDDRGMSATCSSNDVDVEALHARAWLTGDAAGGMTRSSREDIMDSPSSAPLGGVAIGITVPFDPGADSTTAFIARAAAGVAHNNWFGGAVDALFTRQTPGGFFGAGAGLWGIGDEDVADVALIAAGGLNLDRYYQAGQTQIYGELRLFAQHISELQDNYAAILGVRVNFRPTHDLRAR